MAFKDERLPVCISFGSTGGPRFRTDVVSTSGGVESRNQIWEFERAAYECAYDAQLPVDWKQMHAFFRIMAGRAHTFRARDPLDYFATTAEGTFIVAANGSPPGWQMVKRYTFGGEYVDRIITKPISGTVTVAAGTVDYDTGVVTNGAMPASWSGEFDVHVRFDTDDMRVGLLNKTAGGEYIAGWQSIPLMEVRE